MKWPAAQRPGATAAPAVEAPGWLMPGPLVLRLVLAAVVAVGLSGAVSAWLVTRASGQEAMQRVVRQQTEEVEVVARLLASKIEQSQKVLRTVAAGITPGVLESPSSLEWLLQHGLPAVQFFDTIQVARDNGELRLNLRAGRLEKASDLDPAERDALRRTLIDGKPLVSELTSGATSEARVMFTMPLHREDGSVLGAVAGALRLQSQGLLPPSMVLPARDDSRLLVFTREGTILSHSDPARILGKVSDETGLAPVYARWLDQAQPVAGRGDTQVEAGHIVSTAGMPLPQWFVARVSTSRALLAPLEGAQRQAWWLAAASMLLCMVLVAAAMLWMAQPLAHLTHSARLMLRRYLRRASWPDIAWPRAGGEVGELVRVLQGLGEQGRREQAHRATLHGQFQAVLDHASVGIVISRNGILEVVGRQACVMLGHSASELQGRPARILYASDEDYQRMGERVQAQFAAHGAFNGDVCFLRKDGTPVWARVHGRAVESGEPGAATVWIVEDITAVREAQAQQSWAGRHDPLTQLCNRPGFDQRLAQLLAERSGRPRPPGAAGEPPGDGVVLFLDLDHFTVVNDVAGHDAGDDVLRHVARLLEAQVRQIGWVARVGGDEFLLLIEDVSDVAACVAMANRVLAALSEPFAITGRQVQITCSIGVAPNKDTPVESIG